ncbi:MAG: reductive dehalogenase [bacterium]
MRLFSNRNRPFWRGPYPLERLPRTDTLPTTPPGWSAAGGGFSEEPPPEPGLEQSIAAYLELFQGVTGGEPAPEKAEIEFHPQKMAENLKASAYFLDAAMVGICRLPPEARLGDGGAGNGAGNEGGPGHTHAIVILIEPGLEARPGGPGHDWLAGAQTARGILRGGEIACTLAGYLRQLGFQARAEFGARSRVDAELLTVHAGLGRWKPDGSAVVNPFLGTEFTASVVTTDLMLEPDRPLAPVRSERQLRDRSLGVLLGWGGARPGWKRLRSDHRPAHLGRIPMERVRRTIKPTTYISENVPRVPLRGSFFNRALAGDLGEKARYERTRFALKHPLAAAMVPGFRSMVPHQDGPVTAGGDPTAAHPTAGDPKTGDPKNNSLAVKAACHFLDADITGICEAPAYAWYSHDKDGQPIDVAHKYAIVILIDQGHETMEGASGDDWISGAQSMRAYLRGAEIAGVVARHIRSLGYAARAHTNILSDVLHIPLVLLAGLGEMSRIGETVLNPFLGPRIKTAVITTDMPLEPDLPVDFGLQDFCGKCRKCARECPCNAITMGPKTLFNGYEIWKPDAEKCARYRLTNLKGSACGRCMKMCPFNTEGLLRNRLWLWIATHLPFTRRLLARLDDWLGHGRRNPVKRWWLDVELVEKRIVPARGVNERDLSFTFPVAPEKQKIAHYPADMNPPPDATEPVPVDRAEGLRRGAAAQAPPTAGPPR